MNFSKPNRVNFNFFYLEISLSGKVAISFNRPALHPFRKLISTSEIAVGSCSLITALFNHKVTAAPEREEPPGFTLMMAHCIIMMLYLSVTGLMRQRKQEGTGVWHKLFVIEIFIFEKVKLIWEG
jgi:hypothetical protein